VGDTPARSARDTDRGLQWDGRYQLDLALSRFCTSRVDDDTRPSPAMVRDRELDADRAILETEGFALAAKMKPLRASTSTRVNRTLERPRKIRVLMMQYQIDVLRSARSIFQPELERHTAFDGESISVICRAGTFEDISEDHVGNPRPDASFTDTEILGIRASVSRQHANRWRWSDGRLSLRVRHRRLTPPFFAVLRRF